MRPRTAHALRGPACSLCDIIKFGYFHQVRALISTDIDLESRDSEGRTPLILCAFMEPPTWGASLAMTLIENGTNMAQKDCFDRNVLHYACIYQRFKLVRILMKAIDFDLNQTDYLGCTPLHYAAMTGDVAITQLLTQSFKRYRISLNKRNHRGRTALDEALFAGHVPCSQFIQQELEAAKLNGNVIKDVRFADSLMNCVNSSAANPKDPLLASSVRYIRPKTASLSARHSLGVPEKLIDGFVKSSSQSMGSKPMDTRNSWNYIESKGFKRDEDLIFCAPNDDFRNKPEYVFRLVKKPFDLSSNEISILNDSTYRSSWTESSSSSSGQSYTSATAEDWRNQFKLLFQVYEHQCSPSWRTAKAADVSGTMQETPTSNPEETEEDKKTTRRQSVNSRNSFYSDTKRRQSAIRINKMKSLDVNTDSGLRPLSSKKRVSDR